MKIRERRLKVLGYADDLVLLAEEAENMKCLKKLEKYIDRKGLMLNTKKTKVIRFGRKESKVVVERKRNRRGKGDGIQI